MSKREIYEQKTEELVLPVIEENGFEIGVDINLVHAPERIIPGNMVYELLHNNLSFYKIIVVAT